jgi:hypothetical protein
LQAFHVCRFEGVRGPVWRAKYRAHLLPAFGSLRLEDVTAERIQAWKASLRLSNRTKIKLLTVLNDGGARRRVRRRAVGTGP